LNLGKNEVVLNTFGDFYSNLLGDEMNSKMTVSLVLYTKKAKIDKAIV
jgi:DNA helicase IV